MRLWSALAAAVLAASSSVAHIVLIERDFTSPFPSGLDHITGPISARQAAENPTSNSTRAVASPPSGLYPKNFDLSTYLRESQQSCLGRVRTMKRTKINDSGVAACYNVPIIDRLKGTFEAELRLFNVSLPMNQWAGVKTNQIGLSLKYQNATIQPIKAVTGLAPQAGTNSTQRTARSVDEDYILITDDDYPVRLYIRQSNSTETADPADLAEQAGNVTQGGLYVPQELKTYSCFGQIDSGIDISKMSMDQISTILTPVVMIKTKTGNNSIELDVKSSSFVAGALQHGPAAVTADPPVAKPAEFVLPGVSISIFPLGLIITGSWAFLFILVVGIGTGRRYKFRSLYTGPVMTSMKAI